jgi:hypothetical protein
LEIIVKKQPIYLKNIYIKYIIYNSIIQEILQKLIVTKE